MGGIFSLELVQNVTAPLQKKKHILLTDKQMTTHRLSGTAGIYLCCRVFCFETYLREIQIKKNQIDQKRVKCQGHMVNAL